MRDHLNLAVIMLAVLVLTITTPASFISSGSNIQDIHHQPSVNITSDDDVTVHLTLGTLENVSLVEYQYCELVPLGSCSLLQNMTQGNGTNFTAVVPKNSAGSTIGYKVRIEFDNGSEEYSPSKDSYHEYTIQGGGGDDDDDSPFVPTPLLVIGILAAALMVRKRRVSERSS